MSKEDNILYADFELNSSDMFVITPEGNKFTFPAKEYTEAHEPVKIVDSASHKIYVVRFDV